MQYQRLKKNEWNAQNNKTASFDAYRASGKTESRVDELQQIDGYVMRVS